MHERHDPGHEHREYGQQHDRPEDTCDHQQGRARHGVVAGDTEQRGHHLALEPRLGGAPGRVDGRGAGHRETHQHQDPGRAQEVGAALTLSLGHLAHTTDQQFDREPDEEHPEASEEDRGRPGQQEEYEVRHTGGLEVDGSGEGRRKGEQRTGHRDRVDRPRIVPPRALVPVLVVHLEPEARHVGEQLGPQHTREEDDTGGPL